jgi:enoyl-CoA hydratase
MTDNLVRYERDGAVSTLVMDDGKVNALSPAMFRALNEALDRAEADETVVVLSGRPRRFSGGFDLGVFKQGREPAIEMLEAGARTAERLLSFPAPVVIACTGHALAMGAFLLTTADLRIGTDDPELKIRANEVEIGLTMPHFAVELCRQRLAPRDFQRALITAAPFGAREAVEAGFLDLLVPEADLPAVAKERALGLSRLVRDAYTATKRRTRAASLVALKAAIEADLAHWKRDDPA